MHCFALSTWYGALNDPQFQLNLGACSLVFQTPPPASPRCKARTVQSTEWTLIVAAHYRAAVPPGIGNAGRIRAIDLGSNYQLKGSIGARPSASKSGSHLDRHDDSGEASVDSNGGGATRCAAEPAEVHLLPHVTHNAPERTALWLGFPGATDHWRKATWGLRCAFGPAAVVHSAIETTHAESHLELSEPDPAPGVLFARETTQA